VLINQQEAQSYLNQSKNRFIVFEGINASGKTTLLKETKTYLEACKINHVITHEPGGSPFGSIFRSLLLEKKNSLLLTPEAQFLLFSTERSLHVSKIIKPALDQGKLVLSDRYYMSSLAFQGYGAGLDIEELITLTKWAIQDTEPTLIILLDITVVESLKRIELRGTNTDAFEKENIHFQERVRSGYLALAEKLTTPVLKLNGNDSLSINLEIIKSLIKDF
jgi:dTMP kinase